MTNKSLALSWLLSCPSKTCPRPRSSQHLCGLGPAVLQVVMEKWCVSATSSHRLLGFPSSVLQWPCLPPAQGCVWLPLLGCARAASCWDGAREKLSSGRSCWASSLPPWGCSFPCPARAVVPAAACVHKGDLSLCEQQSSQLSQECDPGCCAAGNGHGLGPCQPAAAPPAQGVWGGRCSQAGIAQCPLGCGTHQPGKAQGAQISLLIVHPTSVGAHMGQPEPPSWS